MLKIVVGVRLHCGRCGHSTNSADLVSMACEGGEARIVLAALIMSPKRAATGGFSVVLTCCRRAGNSVQLGSLQQLWHKVRRICQNDLSVALQNSKLQTLVLSEVLDLIQYQRLYSMLKYLEVTCLYGTQTLDLGSRTSQNTGSPSRSGYSG